MIVVNWFLTKKFINLKKIHELEVNSLGMIFSDDLARTTLYWNGVTKVIINGKSLKIKKLFIEFDNGELVSLTVYENLDLLNLELKKHLNKEVWN